MDYLASEAYRVVDVLSAIDLLDSGKPLARTVALTFDDGFLDVAEHALPILSERGFRATVSSLRRSRTAGRPSRGTATEQPPLLAWEDILELDRDGTLRFEAHSLTHPDLPAARRRRGQNEIAGSKLELENQLGRVVRAFSYPTGLFGKREQRIAAQAGYRTAVSCEPGVNDRSTDRFASSGARSTPGTACSTSGRSSAAGTTSSPALRGLYRRLRYSPG